MLHIIQSENWPGRKNRGRRRGRNCLLEYAIDVVCLQPTSGVGKQGWWSSKFNATSFKVHSTVSSQLEENQYFPSESELAENIFYVAFVKADNAFKQVSQKYSSLLQKNASQRYSEPFRTILCDTAFQQPVLRALRQFWVNATNTKTVIPAKIVG